MGAGMGLVVFVSALSAASVAQEEVIKPGQVSELERLLGAALKAGSFVPNASRTEYNLKTNKPITLGPPSIKQGVPVQFQVGTYLGKPAYITVTTPEKDQQLNETFKNFQIPPGLKAEDPALRLCHGKRHCVKTCTDSMGHEYCCKWDCISYGGMILRE